MTTCVPTEGRGVVLGCASVTGTGLGAGALVLLIFSELSHFLYWAFNFSKPYL